MNEFTLETFRPWLRQTIKVALDGDCAPGDLAVVLRREANELSADGYRTGPASQDYRYELPSTDEHVDTADVFAQIIAGSFGAVRMKVYDLELRHPGNERWAALWAVHDAESGEYVEWLNAATFRSASELEAYLGDLSDRPRDD